MNVGKLLKIGSKKLKDNNIKSFLIDSEIILASVLNKKREDILVNNNELICESKINNFHNLIKRRSINEPIAYILNKKEFWKYDFLVTKDTLIPRPETELLVEKICYENFRSRPYILDIGTGSGCIILSILKEIKNSKGIGVDISKSAINVAKVNAKNLNLCTRAKFLQSLKRCSNKKFDIVVSNPPYIRSNEIKNLDKDIKLFEPKIALDGGNDGLDVMRKLIYKVKNILKVNGTFALEIGTGQYKKVSQILKKNKLREKHLIKDYQNNIRSILCTLLS
tara:strand:- start:32 stop:871 length:840 start_codon:yes stop_codon:yes gene_type:complete